jgi:hypothetical protein
MSDEHKERQDTNPLEGKYANYFKVGYNAFNSLSIVDSSIPKMKRPNCTPESLPARPMPRHC